MEMNGLPLVVMAMETEALPIRERLGLEGPGAKLADRLDARIWSNDLVHLVINGIDPRFEVDSIGTLPAALTTFAAINYVQAEIVISAGTCGGFIQRGGSIGEVIVADQ